MYVKFIMKYIPIQRFFIEITSIWKNKYNQNDKHAQRGKEKGHEYTYTDGLIKETEL